eukprot:GILK01014915.1.p3 GENE.GILK01014915.1~~GILK01014915.1.p3  ORF type:complete len:124 (-),score=8.75 GILK01014915.1:151-522(-)
MHILVAELLKAAAGTEGYQNTSELIYDVWLNLAKGTLRNQFQTISVKSSAAVAARSSEYGLDASAECLQAAAGEDVIKSLSSPHGAVVDVSPRPSSVISLALLANGSTNDARNLPLAAKGRRP